MLSADNLERALQRVVSNRGAPGVDGMSVDELGPWLEVHLGELLERLDQGSYRPAPVRRVEVPKPDGGRRMLGVPTVVDRLVQQAITQVLTPVFDPGFSEHSYGFRPGRGAHQAVRAAQGFLAEGYRFVVDVDLDSFFDRVNHDKLMYRVARKVEDKRLLRLIRRFLEAGVMAEGVKQPTEEGTPQGSPLSPLLSNIILDDLDRELERRGHRFVRYADDLRIFVRSERAGQRVLGGVTTFIESRLKLKVNRAKSGVAALMVATLLGFGFFLTGDGVRLRVSDRALRRVKERIRGLTRRSWAISMPDRIGRLNRFIRGWMAYFGVADSVSVFIRLDGWLRRRLRAVRWEEWKNRQGRYRNLRTAGIPHRDAHRWASSGKGAWRISHTALQRALPTLYWTRHGLVAFTHWHQLRHT